MAIKDYSTTAGSNTSVAGINIAEGCPAANVNNGMRAMMADSRSFYESATWTDLGHTPTRTGATTFTVVGDLTAYYVAGRRIKCTDSSTLYGTIDSSVYSAPNTTVTVTLDSGSLTVSLSAIAVSVIDPTGDPIGAAAIGTPEFVDSGFRVIGSSDATKKLSFEVDGLTTATTRTLTVRDVDGILPVIQTADLNIPATSAGPSSITLSEDTDNGSNTVQIIAPSSIASNRVLTLPDASGTVVTTALTASDTQAGIVELATTAETQTGTDTARSITPAGLKGAISFSKYFESSEQSYPSANTRLTVSHSLGTIPVVWNVVLRCKTADRDFAVGDEVPICDNETSNSWVIWANATNIGLQMTGTRQLPNSGGTYGVITTGSWRVVFRAWA